MVITIARTGESAVRARTRLALGSKRCSIAVACEALDPRISPVLSLPITAERSRRWRVRALSPGPARRVLRCSPARRVNWRASRCWCCSLSARGWVSFREEASDRKSQKQWFAGRAVIDGISCGHHSTAHSCMHAMDCETGPLPPSAARSSRREPRNDMIIGALKSFASNQSVHSTTRWLLIPSRYYPSPPLLSVVRRCDALRRRSAWRAEATVKHLPLGTLLALRQVCARDCEVRSWRCMAWLGPRSKNWSRRGLQVDKLKRRADRPAGGLPRRRTYEYERDDLSQMNPFDIVPHLLRQA